MGSGASAFATIPEKLSEADAKQLCGDKYDAQKFIALKDSNGFISRENFSLIISDDIEQRSFEVFMSFCPVGQLDSRTFIKICRDCKIFNKNFNTTDADLIFQKVRAKFQISAKVFNYDYFRNYVVPEIATKNNVDITRVLKKIANSSGPTLNGVTEAEPVRLHDDPSTYTGAHAVLPRQSIAQSLAGLGDYGSNQFEDVLNQSAGEAKPVEANINPNLSAATRPSTRSSVVKRPMTGATTTGAKGTTLPADHEISVVSSASSISTRSDNVRLCDYLY